MISAYEGYKPEDTLECDSSARQKGISVYTDKNNLLIGVDPFYS
jgi:hypothetical protein